MRQLLLTVCILLATLAAGPVSGQYLDGRPYSPEYDADIDLYLNSFENSDTRTLHGNLLVRDILTRGSHLDPPRQGAVLEYANLLARAELPSKQAFDTTLMNEQYVLYIMSGEGMIVSGRKKSDLRTNMAVFIPEGRRFSMAATGDEPLVMLLLSDPTYEGFEPATEIVVKDESTTPISNTRGHWCHIVRGLFSQGNTRLATVATILTVDIAPMTIPHPHSHEGAFEELWTVIHGESIAFLDKHIRHQTSGMGYMAVPDGDSPHSNINESDGMVKMLYVLSRKDQ
jgi:mannose-6-phosphate isomerase-like protein (cupin superfamily)